MKNVYNTDAEEMFKKILKMKTAPEYIGSNFMEVIIDFAEENYYEIDYVADVLSESSLFKNMFKNDCINNGLVYIDGERQYKKQEW